MKYQPLVSILINNYNKQKYCTQALRSAIFQNYKKIEIIFFDDCSTDYSLKKIEKLKKKFKNKIKIIKNKDRGNTYSFNQMHAIKKSVEKSKGKIICLLDSDDFFKKNKVKEIVNFFSKNPSQEILFDCPLIYKNKDDRNLSLDNFFIRENKWPKFPPTSCMSFEAKTLKNVIKKNNFKKFPNLAIDFFLAVYYSVILKNFYIHKSHLTYYRQVGDGTDSNYIKYRSSKW